MATNYNGITITLVSCPGGTPSACYIYKNQAAYSITIDYIDCSTGSTVYSYVLLSNHTICVGSIINVYGASPGDLTRTGECIA